MTTPAILVICLKQWPGAPEARAMVERKLGEGHTVTVLASSETTLLFKGLSVTLWPDGAPKGLLRLLALVRRISWGQFSAIYDLDGSRRTKAYRWFVRPCPPWYVSPGYVSPGYVSQEAQRAQLSTCKDKAS